MTKSRSLIDAAAIGVEVSWAFGDGNADAVKISRVRVAEALTAGGFDPALHFPDKTEAEILRQTTRMASSPRGILVREMGRPNKDTPIAIGIYRRNSERGEAGDEWECGARVRIQQGEAVCLPPEGAQFIDECFCIGDVMVRQAEELKTTAYNGDISLMLTSVGKSLNWVSRRPNGGGVYFLLTDRSHLTDRAERFVSLLKNLESFTDGLPISRRFRPQAIEVFSRPLAEAALSQAARTVFEADVKSLVKDLQQLKDAGKMHTSTMRKRATECDDVMRRAEEYKAYLAEMFDDLSRELTNVRNQFVMAINLANAQARCHFDRLEEMVRVEASKPETALEQKPEAKKSTRRGRRVSDAQLDVLFDIG